MKESEYFQKAFQDSVYRREKIAELRDHARFALWFLICGSALLIVVTVVSGFTEGHWREGLTGMFPSVILMAWVHTNTKTRLAALEAMEGKQTVPAAGALERSAT